MQRRRVAVCLKVTAIPTNTRMSNMSMISRLSCKHLQSIRSSFAISKCFASSSQPGSNKGNTSKSSQEKKPKQQKQVNVNTGDDYKAPEYYQHNSMTFNDYMVAMQKMRLPQPSNKA